MTNIYLYLGIFLGLIFIGIILYLILKKQGKDTHPVISRSKDMIIIINQRINTVYREIQQKDKKVNELVMKQEKTQSSEKTEKVSQLNTEIQELIADIEDLNEFKNNIEEKIKKPKRINIDELQEYLTYVADRIKFRYT